LIIIDNNILNLCFKVTGKDFEFLPKEILEYISNFYNDRGFEPTKQSQGKYMEGMEGLTHLEANPSCIINKFSSKQYNQNLISK
jgi:hypothetical protein